MKVKVLKEFTDVHSGKVHPVGETFECTQERLDEINSVSKSLVKTVRTAKQADDTKKEVKE